MLEKEIYAGIAVAMMLVSRGVYFGAIFRGLTRPHAFSWFIWGIISSIGVAAQVVEGAGVGAWPRLLGAVTCFIIVTIACFRGEKNVTRSDWIVFIAALCAIPLWMATKTPVWSVILVCVIDTVGYFPTIRKSWHKPHEEAAWGYFLSSFGAFFSVLALENYTPSTWLYPVVLTLSNGTMCAYLLLRRRLKVAVA